VSEAPKETPMTRHVEVMELVAELKAAEQAFVLATVVRTVPEGFTIHPKLERQFAQRDDLVAKGYVDWSLAEALAIGSLLYEGVNVRLTGQDSGRGTFFHRHAVLHDQASGRRFVPLQHLATNQPTFTVTDSVLSEEAVMGFEYGFLQPIKLQFRIPLKNGEEPFSRNPWAQPDTAMAHKLLP